MATENTTSKQTTAARPFAESPAPEQFRVDPGSIACEEIKARNPDAPQPVFSTMALAHGTNAAGAAALRPGFSWNAQMDLLWALGYPHVVFVVDGFPAEDTKQGILDYWNAEKREFRWWRDRAKSGNPRVVSRRGAFAQVYELANRKNPFQLPDDEFLRATEPRQLDEAEVVSILRNIKTDQLIERAALVLEALVGPSCIAEALCLMVEDTTIEGRGNYRGNAAHMLRVFLRRVPPEQRDSFKERLQRVPLTPGSDPDESYVNATLDPVASALGSIAQGKAQYALGPLQWADGREDLVVQCYDARPEVPDVPAARNVFVGGDALIEREVANFDKYSDGVDAYIHDYSTIRHLSLLKPGLSLLSTTAFRETVTRWLQAHTGSIRPLLEELEKDGEYEQPARAALKLLAFN